MRRVLPGAGQLHDLRGAEVHDGKAQQRPAVGAGELCVVQPAVPAAGGVHVHDGHWQPTGRRQADVPQLAALLHRPDAVWRMQARQLTVLPVCIVEDGRGTIKWL